MSVFSQAELEEEYRICKLTRLGILCEDRFPTGEQEQIAHIEARALITRLRSSSKGLQQLIDFAESL